MFLVVKYSNTLSYAYYYCLQENNLCIYQKVVLKSRIRDTKHLSTDADSSTDAKREWTENTQKPDFFEKKRKNHQRRNNSETSKNMTKLAIRPSPRGL